jgi:hypothetical protein
MSWKSPTGHTTPTDWHHPAEAYDEDVEIFTYYQILPLSWSPFLELLVSPGVLCDKVRFYPLTSYSFPAVDIDVYGGGNWFDTYEGPFTIEQWCEKVIPDGPFVVSKARIRFYNSHTVLTGQMCLGEFDFNQLAVRPLVDGSSAGSGLIRKGLVR